MRKDIVLFIFCLGLLSVCEAELGESRFFFHQQVNDMSMIAPMLNLRLLEKAKGFNDSSQYDFSRINAYTKMEWFVFNQKPLALWYRSFDTLNDLLSVINYYPLVSYVNQAVAASRVETMLFRHEDDPLLVPFIPHFFVNYKNFLWGTNSSEAISHRFVEDQNDLWRTTVLVQSPTGLSSKGPSLGVKIPFVNDGGVYKIFYAKNDQIRTFVCDDGIVHTLKEFFDVASDFPVMNNIKYLEEWDGPHKKRYFSLMKIIDEKLNYLNLKSGLSYRSLFVCREGCDDLGVESVGMVGHIGRGYTKDDDIYLPHYLGLYKLMFLRLGLDDRNVAIQEGCSLADVSANLNTIIDSYGNDHPWSKSLFSKDKFLQYEIAEVLKNNKELQDELRLTIDFYFKPWKAFCLYKGKKNGAGEQFLPGDEQALALMATHAVRYLLYGACSKNGRAFEKAVLPMKRLHNITFDAFKAAAYYGVCKPQQEPGLMNRWASCLSLYGWYYRLFDHTSERISFLEVWAKIRNALHLRWDSLGMNRRNWVSFDGHGWVASFDNNLFDKQLNTVGVDRELLQDLGVVGVDSVLGDDLAVFYKA